MSKVLVFLSLGIISGVLSYFALPPQLLEDVFWDGATGLLLFTPGLLFGFFFSLGLRKYTSAKFSRLAGFTALSGVAFFAAVLATMMGGFAFINGAVGASVLVWAYSTRIFPLQKTHIIYLILAGAILSIPFGTWDPFFAKFITIDGFLVVYVTWQAVMACGIALASDFGKARPA